MNCTEKESRFEHPCKDIIEHFGFDPNTVEGVGTWPHDERLLGHVKNIPEAFERLRDESKPFKMCFCYEPDYPVALFLVYGLKHHENNTTVSSTDSRKAELEANQNLHLSPSVQ